MAEQENRKHADGILFNFDRIEEMVKDLMKKYVILKKENRAITRRVEMLEVENESLRERKQVTVNRLKGMLEKLDEAGI